MTSSFAKLMWLTTTFFLFISCRSANSNHQLKESIDLRSANGKSTLLWLRDLKVALYQCEQDFPKNGEYFTHDECPNPVANTHPVALNDFDLEVRQQLGLREVKNPKDYLKGLNTEIDAMEKRVLELRQQSSSDVEQLERDLEANRQRQAQLAPSVAIYVQIVDHLMTPTNTRFYSAERAYTVANQAFERLNAVQAESETKRQHEELKAKREQLARDLVRILEEKHNECMARAKAGNPTPSYLCTIHCDCELQIYCSQILKKTDSRFCREADRNAFLYIESSLSERPNYDEFAEHHCRGERIVADYTVQKTTGECGKGERRIATLARKPNALQVQCDKQESPKYAKAIQSCIDAKYEGLNAIAKQLTEKFPE